MLMSCRRFSCRCQRAAPQNFPLRRRRQAKRKKREAYTQRGCVDAWALAAFSKAAAWSGSEDMRKGLLRSPLGLLGTG